MSKKIILSLFIFCSVGGFTGAQSPDLERIFSKVKSTLAPVDTFDRANYLLKYFDSIPAADSSSEKLLLTIYKAVSAGYTANNHFKQGYGVFQKYLALKETISSKEKTKIIASARITFDKKQKDDESEVFNLQNKVQQINIDCDALSSKRINFKRFFSLGIFVITLLFAFRLLRSGLRLRKIKIELVSNRQNLKSNHRITVVGNFIEGVRLTISANATHVFEQCNEIISLLSKNDSSGKVKLLEGKFNEIKKSSSEIIKNFKP